MTRTTYQINDQGDNMTWVHAGDFEIVDGSLVFSDVPRHGQIVVPSEDWTRVIREDQPGFYKFAHIYGIKGGRKRQRTSKIVMGPANGYYTGWHVSFYQGGSSVSLYPRDRKNGREVTPASRQRVRRLAQQLVEAGDFYLLKDDGQFISVEKRRKHNGR